ncbi:MAG: hypothetical protein GY930_00530, partial [bacterium]|nr:hypothetical protein [bacterium]
MTMNTQVHEPHKIKTVRLLTWPKLEKRKRLLADAGFNVFNLSPHQVSFDMCSMGTSAFSQKQLAGQYIGDEAYAGARNFMNLEKSAREVLGVEYICPTHNLLGALKLVVHTMATPGTSIVGNSTMFRDIASLHKVGSLDVRDASQEIFTGDVDLVALRKALEGGAKMVAMQAFAGGQHPFSLANLTEVKDLADEYDALLVLDASRIIENAWFIQQHETNQGQRTIAGLVKELADLVRILIMDGAQDPKASTGGFIGVSEESDREILMNEVVVFEGLHTYGGMAGRTMEVLSRGLTEMCSEAEVQWVMQQTLAFTARLRAGGVPLERGCDGAYIQADKFLPHLDEHQQDALSANLYLVSGVRAVAHGRVQDNLLVPVQIPRLAMTNEQLDQVADAIIHLYKQADKVPTLHFTDQGAWRDQMRYRSIFANLDNFDFDTAPFNIHTVEYVGLLTKEERQKAILEAGYNTFLLRSEDVTIDLLTDSGTTAMSTDQWAAYDRARASATTSEEYNHFVEVLQEVLGYEHIIPTHQGRAAEHILSQIMIKPGQFVPGNMYFTTTKLHQEMAGGIFADIIVDEAHQPDSDFLWKGNIDLDKLRILVEEHGAEKIAYISFEHSVNM